MRLEDTKNAIKGTVITSTDASWADATDALVWTGRKPNAAPTIIVRAADTADVQVAVRFAAAQGLKVSAASRWDPHPSRFAPLLRRLRPPP